MSEEIKIIDGSIKANVLIRDNTIYVYTNSNSFDLKKYIKIFQSYSLDELIKKSESAIVFKGHGKKKSKTKLHLLGTTAVLGISAVVILHAVCLNDYNVVTYQQENQEEINDFTTKDIYSFINSSEYLTDEEKAFLYNEDLFNDILPIINESNFLKQMYLSYFNNLRIQNFTEQPDCIEESIKQVLGYYDTDYPSTMFIKNYYGLTEENKDQVAHEFIHVCQNIWGYNLIIEGTCEITKSEYYNIPISRHTRQAKLVKILMEIIGPEPVFDYSFSGDFSQIENSVRPYLSEEDYNLFLDSLVFDYGNYENNKPRFKQLELLLAKIYQAKFNDDIKDNKVIQLIESGDRTLRRYYFNKKYINEENSYYLGYEEGQYQTMSLEESVDNGYVQITAIKKEEVSYEDALLLTQSGDYNIERVIDYESADIKISSTKEEHSKMYITGTINGIEYEEVDIDTLVEEGIIKLTYYLVNARPISVADYMSHNYDDNTIIQINHSDDTQINGDVVTCFVPKKIFIPPVGEQEKYISNELKLELELYPQNSILQ